MKGKVADSFGEKQRTDVRLGRLQKETRAIYGYASPVKLWLFKSEK